jgi:D-tyrosyl-tRNA(Tyr) deacylase
VAEPLVQAVIDELRNLGASVATGRFQAHMRVQLVNDGPVTIVLDV